MTPVYSMVALLRADCLHGRIRKMVQNAQRSGGSVRSRLNNGEDACSCVLIDAHCALCAYDTSLSLSVVCRCPLPLPPRSHFGLELHGSCPRFGHTSMASASHARQIQKVYSEWCVKAAEIILASRLDDPHLDAREQNPSFNLKVAEFFNVRAEQVARPEFFQQTQRSFQVEVCLGPRDSRSEDLNRLLERWTFTFFPARHDPSPLPDRLNQTLVRKLSVSLRSLLCFSRLLPAYAFCRAPDAEERHWRFKVEAWIERCEFSLGSQMCELASFRIANNNCLLVPSGCRSLSARHDAFPDQCVRVVTSWLRTNRQVLWFSGGVPQIVQMFVCLSGFDARWWQSVPRAAPKGCFVISSGMMTAPRFCLQRQGDGRQV